MNANMLYTVKSLAIDWLILYSGVKTLNLKTIVFAFFSASLNAINFISWAESGGKFVENNRNL